MGKNLLQYLALAGITIVVFFPVFNGGFIAWDDAEYIQNNIDIKSFSIENVQKIFTSFYLGNYQPISILSYIPDFLSGQGSAKTFHISSVLIHVLTTFVVFSLIKELSKNTLLSFFVAILYSIHPMQVESVAWIAERKNVVYGFFYWLSIWSFIIYIKNVNYKFYLFSLLAFILSLLSKGQAVSLPLSLIGIIYLSGYEDKIKNILIKLIPFFLLSLLFGCIAIYAQSQHGYINPHRNYNILEKISISSVGYIMYAWKIMLPINLSVLYPIPTLVPYYYFLSIIAIVLLIFFIVRSLIKGTYSKVIGFIFFYSSNIIFILQIIPVGEGIIADRYAYIAILPMTYCFFDFLHKKTRYMYFVGGLIIILFGYNTYKRSYIWQNSLSLFTDATNKYPNAEIALNSLGAAYIMNNNYTEAHKVLNKAIRLDSNYFQAYYNKSIAYRKQRNDDSSFFCLDKTLAIQPLYKDAYLDQALILKEKNNYSEAVNKFNEYLKFDPDNGEVFYFTGLCYDLSGNSSFAIRYYTKSIENNYTKEYVYLNRAIAFGRVNNFTSALEDIDFVLKRNPSNAQANYVKGIALFRLGKDGCEFLKLSVDLKYTPAKEAIKKYCPNLYTQTMK